MDSRGPDDGPPTTLLIACGALAREVVDVIRLNGLSHVSVTCLPAIWQDGLHTVVNNGSAGMGNLAGDTRGLITRISTVDPGAPSLSGLPLVQQGGLSVSLLPLSFELESWLALFDSWWPRGSDAALSYRERIVGGTQMSAEDIFLSTVG